MKLLAASLIVVLAFAGCGDSTPPESGSGDSGIVVEATLGPGCPGPTSTLPSCGPQPYSGQLQVIEQATGQVVARFSTDAEGRARADLAAGSYQVETPSPGIPGAAPVSVEVSPGTYSQVHVSVDTGMR